MASADSKYDVLSDADIDSLIEKATGWGISVLKGKVANFKFFIQASGGVASHAGVFRGEIRAPLKAPAWEAS